MRLRWTTPATQDLYNIVRRILQDNPDAAVKVAKTLHDGCGGLGNFPRRGRKGRMRELANWSSLACPTSLSIAFKIKPWKSCASIMEHKTGPEPRGSNLRVQSPLLTAPSRLWLALAAIALSALLTQPRAEEAVEQDGEHDQGEGHVHAIAFDSESRDGEGYAGDGGGDEEEQSELD
jgi:plasmid stabilization system protein ParE